MRCPQSGKVTLGGGIPPFAFEIVGFSVSEKLQPVIKIAEGQGFAPVFA